MPNPFALRLSEPVRAGLLLLAAAGSLPALASAVPYTGASVSGGASGRMELSCQTCTNYPIIFANEAEVGFAVAGGQGATSASLSRPAVIDRDATLASFPRDPNLIGPVYTLGGGAGFAASAQLSGPLATPLLRARADTDNVRVFSRSVGFDPDLFVGWDFFSAMAFASITQGYTFSGTERTTYTFEFTFDGLLQDPRASLSASVAVHNGDGETGVRARANESLATLLLSGTEFLSASFTIDMVFDPGETLYLEAGLSASADASAQFGLPDQGTISANGMNTMWVSNISGGNIGFLTPTLTAMAVPEPASLGLALLGLGAFAMRQRRRGAAASARAVR